VSFYFGVVLDWLLSAFECKLNHCIMFSAKI